MLERRIAVLTAVGVTVSACGLMKIDHKKVEQSIKTQAAAKGLDLTSIDCPKNIPLKQGEAFACNGVDADGKNVSFRVDQTDSKGDIQWKLDGMIIDKQKVGDSIEKSVGAAADVTCPAKTVVLNVGDSFTCDVKIAGNTRKVTITLTNTKGDVSWKIPPG
jgi:hypothetical protein